MRESEKIGLTNEHGKGRVRSMDNSKRIPTYTPGCSDVELYTYLDAKRGSITVRANGDIVAHTYTLRDESAPDTYTNRHWYEAAYIYDGSLDLVGVARKVFATGTLRETTDGLDSARGNRCFAVFA